MNKIDKGWHEQKWWVESLISWKYGPDKIAIFEGKKIRRHWDNRKELWYFSVISEAYEKIVRLERIIQSIPSPNAEPFKLWLVMPEKKSNLKPAEK